MKKFIFSDNGTLIDRSVEVEDYHSGSIVMDYTTSTDAVYVGSELPFNSLFFDVASANAVSAAPTISYWDGSQWRTMVEVLDETSLGGVSLAQSGHVTWVTDKNYGWLNEDTVNSNGTERITGLGNATVYDLFWLKITFDATLTNTTEINFIGPKFCEDADVTGEHTMLSVSAFKSNYESGKTNWEREIILASRLLVEDLIDKAAIISGDQLLQRRKLRDACVSKVAELVYSNLGDDYQNDAQKARAEYSKRLNKKNYGADKNSNARLDKREMGVMTGGLYR